MRIVSGEATIVVAPFPTPLLFDVTSLALNATVVVQLYSAEGAVGFGYVPTLGFGAAALRAVLTDDLLPRLVGQALESVSDGVDRLVAIARIGGRVSGLVRQAIAVIEMALYDIEAQLAGLPLYALWGQSPVAVPAYASGGWRYLPTEALVKTARRWVEAGFTAMKIQIGLSPDEDAARIRAVREAVGPEVGIMLDANQRLPPGSATDWCAALAPFAPNWVEEPLPAEQHRALARLRGQVGSPIAAGESESERDGLDDLLDLAAVDVLQPDIHRVGIGAAREAVRAAASRGIDVAPHMAHEISAHLVSDEAIYGWLEYFDWFEDWWETPALVVRGMVSPSDRTGHGLRLRPGWLEEHRIQ